MLGSARWRAGGGAAAALQLKRWVAARRCVNACAGGTVDDGAAVSGTVENGRLERLVPHLGVGIVLPQQKGGGHTGMPAELRLDARGPGSFTAPAGIRRRRDCRCGCLRQKQGDGGGPRGFTQRGGGGFLAQINRALVAWSASVRSGGPAATCLLVGPIRQRHWRGCGAAPRCLLMGRGHGRVMGPRSRAGWRSRCLLGWRLRSMWAKRKRAAGCSAGRTARK